MMDIITDDQSFHGSLANGLACGQNDLPRNYRVIQKNVHIVIAHQFKVGLDNPGLDLPSDLEDIIFKGDGSMCISDDVISHGVFGGSSYSTGTNGSCSLSQNNLPGQGQSLIQGHGHLGDPQDHRHINGLADQLSQHLQQQLHQQYHSHQQQLHQHPSHSSSCEHEGHPQQHCHPNHQQQQQQNSYCSISGQPQYAFEVYDHSHVSHTSLPDSPPDSGSEPYSPPDGNLHHQAMTDLKSTIPGSLSTIPQAMYLAHNNRLGGMPPNKAPPAYIGEPSKLNHHHQGPPLPPQLQQQQDQQHQQGQRVPLPYPASVSMGQHMPTHQISPPLSHPILPAHMGSMANIGNQVAKKRKYPDSPTGTLNSSMMHGINGILSIKQEPPGAQFSSYIGECSVGDDDLSPYDIDSNGAFIDSTYQVIKWQPYSQTQWAVLTDGDFKDLPTPQYRVDADKGFNFSVPDEAFVCQKKNHFQVTVYMRLQGNAKYLRTMEGMKKIENYFLHFYGVKMESQNQNIKIEQSQSDRSKKSFHPVKVDLPADQETKVTVGRLHFSETTSNNMRKKGKPNPDQRYFLLVVSLHAHCGDKDYMLVGSVSDRIIVRASNPGQFDSDVDVMWQKGQTQESVYHMGKVGVNTEHPEEALTVHGNMRLTGHMTQPSDRRAKKNIEEINPKNQLENVSKLRIYKYTYREDYAAHAGIPPDNREDTGVLAQEILDVLPDAVQMTGDIVLPSGETIDNFLVVNKDRIFMENVGAVKELCKLTDNLEVRIDQLEKMNKRLGKLKRFDSLKSTSSSLSAKSISTISCTSSVGPKQFSNNSSHATDKGSCRNSHHSNVSSRGGSHGRGLNESKSTLSLISWPFKKKCNGWFRYIIAGLILLMMFCVAALACLYILEVQKPDADTSVVSPSESDLGILPTTESKAVLSTSDKESLNFTSSRAPVTITSSINVSTVATSGSTVATNGRMVATNGNTVATSGSTVATNGRMVTTSGSTVATSGSTVATSGSTVATTTSSITTVSTNGIVSLMSSNQPAYGSVIPPYPLCTQNYCEKLCCPPPHEDDHNVIVSGNEEPPSHGNSGGEDNESSNNEEEVQFITKSTMPTKSKQMETVVINLPENNSSQKNVDYHVINNLNKPQRYDVYNQNNNPQEINSVYAYRKRRGADDAPRPVIKIIELNYTLSDVFCEFCQAHNYSYFVPYNASFGYQQITLEFLTPTMSYMALCNSTFMWRCPIPSEDDAVVIGNVFQQTNNATWAVKLGNHFRTILAFRVIHSLKGKQVNQANACTLQNNQDYVVMSYNIRFQRYCG